LNLAQPDEVLARRPGWPDLDADMPLSLLNVIRNSEETLSEKARLAWRALALFEPKPNTFDEVAALAVCAEEPEALDELVDAGLIEVDANGRYSLHQTICDYARGVMPSPQPAPVNSDLREEERAGHMVAHFAQFTEANRTNYAAIETETTNILRALALAHEQGHVRGYARDLIRMAVAFYTFASVRGLYDTIEVHLNRAVTAAQSPENNDLLPSVLLNLGWLARKRGDARTALALFEHGLAHAEAALDRERQSALLLGLATVSNDLSEYLRAREFGQRGLALAEDLQEREITTMLLIELALISSRLNQAEAYDFLIESVKMARETGDQRLMSTALAGMGITSFWKGECDEGERYLREGMALSQAIGFAEMHGLTLALQAWVDANRGDYDRADALAEESLRITQAVQFTEAIYAAHLALGTTDFHRGKLSEAEAHLQEGLRLAQQVDQRESMGWLLGMLARVCMQQGDWGRAEKLAQEGLQVARSAQHAEMVSPLLAVLGQLAAHQQKSDEAKQFFDEAMQHARATQFPWLVCYTQQARGEWLLEQGQFTDAQSAFEEARDIAARLGAKELLAKALGGLAELCASGIS
jgi:tetratricopeptide (TPR) repeat protein